MSSTTLNQESLRQLVTDILRAPGFRRATFGGPARGAAPSRWKRVVVRPVAIRGERLLQFSYFDARRHVTKNYRLTEIDAPLSEILQTAYGGIHLATHGEEIDVRTTRKGKLLLSRRKADSSTAESSLAHDRVKDVPLPEGRQDRFLEVMGILTRDGRVRPAMRAKYTQINECLKLLSHVLDDVGVSSLGREVEILDCGCGSSYLTLAVHHYLNDLLGIPARVAGVDVNEDVIRKSVRRAEHLGAEDVRFACSRIGAVDARPDIVLALHACDTATDDALALAVRTQARLVLSAPCCHHHLNERLGADGPAHVLRPLLRHGILKQRTADLVTDAFRALALRIMGYRTEVIEFISPEHTARNLMIRAVYGTPRGDAALIREYQEMRCFWGVTPYLEQALGEPFQRLVGSAG